MKYLYIFALMLFANSAFANNFPSELDHFSKNGLQGKIIELYDPNGIIIELDSGQLLKTSYKGIEFEILFNWLDSGKKNGTKRAVLVFYKSSNGVVVKDNISGKEFNLSGTFQPHIIDISESMCKNKYSTTLGIIDCKNLALKAWDAELNKAYKELGGNKNKKLKASQKTWINFRDAQIDFLANEYGSRDGTIWDIVYKDHEISITKEQTLRLKSIKEW